MKNGQAAKELNRILRGMDKALADILTALTGILFLGVIVSVILRYFFGLSSAWSEELLTMCFIATTFFGASLCLREKEHISIAMISDSGSVVKKKFYSILRTAIVIVVCAVIFYYSVLWIKKVGKVPSPATGIPNGIFYLIVPVSFGLTILYAVADILAEFIQIDQPITKSVFVGSNEPSNGDKDLK